MRRHLYWLAVLVTSAGLAQEPPDAKRDVDVTKRRVVERSTEALVAELSQREELAAASVEEVRPAAAEDRTKALVIEPAAEAVVRSTQPMQDVEADGRGASAGDDNPRVVPGKVNWHDDVGTAIAAAKSSGKPILVFHLLGNLDQRFT